MVRGTSWPGTHRVASTLRKRKGLVLKYSLTVQEPAHMTLVNTLVNQDQKSYNHTTDAELKGKGSKINKMHMCIL